MSFRFALRGLAMVVMMILVAWGYHAMVGVPKITAAEIATRPKPANLTGEANGFWDDAVKGSSEAAYRLGVCFMEGKGAAQSDLEANFWLRVAEQADFPRAAGLMGEVHEKGLLGNKVDMQAAADSYYNGAKLGDLPSQFWVSEAMRLGRDNGDLEKELPTALTMYICSASKGYGPSAAVLAGLYTTGCGSLPKDARMAYLWALLAGAYGLPDAKMKAANETLIKSSEIALAAEDVAWLQTRRDAVLAYAVKFGAPTVDDAPEATASIPPEGVTGKTPADSTLIKVMFDFDGKKSHSFIIDSGCSCSSVSPDVAKDLGLVSVGQASQDFSGPSDIYLLSGHIFGAEFKNLRVTAMEYPASFKGYHIEGLLGGDFIRLLRVRYDYKRKLATLLPPGPARAGGVPLTFKDSTPNATVTVEGMDHSRFETTAILDTGNWGDVLVNDDLNRLHPFGKLVSDATDETYGGGDGEHDVKTGKTGALSLGGFRVPNPFLTFEPGHTAANSEPLNVGIVLLRKFVLELDFANARLYLEPNDSSVVVEKPQILSPLSNNR